VTPVYQSGDVNTNNILETTETWIYTAVLAGGAVDTSLLAGGYYHNVGTVVGTPPTGDNVTDSNPDNYHTAPPPPPPPPPDVPASSNLSLWLLVGMMAVFLVWRNRRAHS
jgi:hypothetical protein